MWIDDLWDQRVTRVAGPEMGLAATTASSTGDQSAMAQLMTAAVSSVASAVAAALGAQGLANGKAGKFTKGERRFLQACSFVRVDADFTLPPLYEETLQNKSLQWGFNMGLKSA